VFTGRFIQQDPIGLRGGDVNYYAYVKNTSINLADPFGLNFTLPSLTTATAIRIVMASMVTSGISTGVDYARGVRDTSELASTFLSTFGTSTTFMLAPFAGPFAAAFASGTGLGLGAVNLYRTAKLAYMGQLTSYDFAELVVHSAVGAAKGRLNTSNPRNKPPPPSTPRFGMLKNKLKAIEYASGKGDITITGKLIYFEANWLGKEWVGSGHKVRVTPKFVIYISKEGLRQYRSPTHRKKSPYTRTGIQASFQSRNNANEAWTSNVHIDVVDE
jgi:hypothetical protein